MRKEGTHRDVAMLRVPRVVADDWKRCRRSTASSAASRRAAAGCCSAAPLPATCGGSHSSRESVENKELPI